MVHDAMPEKARRHLEGVENIQFYDTSKAASDGIAEWAANAGYHEVAAKYRNKPPKSLGGCNSGGNNVWVDGVEEMPEQHGSYKEGGMKARGLLAHELTHSLDYMAGWIGSASPQYVQLHSRTEEWFNIFNKEINTGGSESLPKLTSYAGTSASEGFAEFGRLLYGSDVPHEEIRARFPNASAFFTKLGFWPNARGPALALSGPSGRMLPEIFSERVMLGIDDRSHVDCLIERGGGVAPTDRPRPIALAMWANQVQRDCLRESGGDTSIAFRAAGYILATQPPPN